LNLIQDDPRFKAVVVENGGKRDTYLDELPCDVLYTNNNSNKLCRHKGVTELLELFDIKAVIQEYNIQDDDMIIKLTGRYKLLSSQFLDLVLREQSNYEVFMKFFNVCTKEYLYDDCVLGLFAIRCQYLKQFQYACIRGPECEFASFVRKTIDPSKIKELTDLSMECCFAYDLGILNV
jgi:hypothetical protein